jgi:hypothetical protein
VKEINDFASVLDTALAARDTDVIALAVNTVGLEMRELIEWFPDHKDPSVTGGEEERRRARSALKDLVLRLRRIDAAATAGKFDDAAAEYRNYRNLSLAAVPNLLRAAQSWSLFNPAVHDAHFAALQRTLKTAKR